MLDDVSNAFAVIPGTKTDDSLEIIPIPHTHAVNLLAWKAVCPSKRWAFPSCAPHSKNFGQQTYHRERMFEAIRKKTALEAYRKSHPEVTAKEAYEAVKRENFRGGIKLVPKDLRDYFCNEVAANTDDPIVLMALMRHKSLQTTTKYTRRILERMKMVVANFGSKKDSQPGAKSTVNSLLEVLREVREIRASVEELREKTGGGGQTRTVDSADMSRVL
jgi:integrase